MNPVRQVEHTFLFSFSTLLFSTVRVKLLLHDVQILAEFVVQRVPVAMAPFEQERERKIVESDILVKGELCGDFGRYIGCFGSFLVFLAIFNTHYPIISTHVTSAHSSMSTQVLMAELDW